jgi:F-type H+-transporting ATPase subunit c
MYFSCLQRCLSAWRWSAIMVMTIKRLTLNFCCRLNYFHIKENKEMEFNQFFVDGLKLLGAGLAMLGAIGAGVGVGIAASGGAQAMGRNPDAAPIIQTNMILGMAFAEAVAIYALAVALIIIFAA